MMVLTFVIQGYVVQPKSVLPIGKKSIKIK